MRQRNNCSLLVFFILTALSLANSQTQSASPEQPASAATPQTTPSAPASGATPGSAAQSNGSSGVAQNPDSGDSGVFIFH